MVVDDVNKRSGPKNVFASTLIETLSKDEDDGYEDVV